MFCKVEDGLFSILGISSAEKLSGYEGSQSADLTHLATGAVIVFVLFVLWSAHGHFADVLHKAWNPNTGIEDGEELLRYRTAVIGFGASFLFIAVGCAGRVPAHPHHREPHLFCLGRPCSCYLWRGHGARPEQPHERIGDASTSFT